jgi:hypothetical protein
MIQRIHMRDERAARGPMMLISRRLEPTRHIRVILGAATISPNDQTRAASLA